MTSAYAWSDSDKSGDDTKVQVLLKEKKSFRPWSSKPDAHRTLGFISTSRLPNTVTADELKAVTLR